MKDLRESNDDYELEQIIHIYHHAHISLCLNVVKHTSDDT
jgi:hypothetical protein